MNLENLKNKEPLIKNFFTWLFDDNRIIDKNVILEKELDIALAPHYEDANIYYPKQISAILDTKAMKRLGRISQLDLAIEVFPNLYHNRLEHSKGVYYRKLEEMLYNFQHPEWKANIENRKLKLYLLADLIKMLGHDIGHLPLSHALEIQILSQRGAHEIIGKRIMLENPEIHSILTSISPDLPNTLKDLYDKNILNFKEHDESNYDVDRLDYISRDNLYAGNPVHIPHLQYTTIPVIMNDKGCAKFNDDNSILVSTSSHSTIDVYDYDSLHIIENFLETRESGYINMYLATKTHIRENSISALFKTFLKTNSKSGTNLKHFVTRLKSVDLNIDDLSFLLDWDDLKFYSEILDIAENHEDNNVQFLATMTIPSMNTFLTMIYSHLNIYNKGQSYSEEDKKFLKNIKKIIQEQTTLSSNLRNVDFAMDNTLIFPQDEPLPTNYSTFINDGFINSHSVKIKAYNPNEPIYIKGSDGKIYELSHHPDRMCDWNSRLTYLNYLYTYIPYLKFHGISDIKIKEMCDFCRNRNDIETSTKTNYSVNMQPLQVGHNIEDVFLEI